mmetsp:Transcript_88785/g.286950  ORF Transcript_88785/g.286950 Transcript_88785/m.286950 type:complete len:480 (+) Transcript_88785:1060-2499(+)
MQRQHCDRCDRHARRHFPMSRRGLRTFSHHLENSTCKGKLWKISSLEPVIRSISGSSQGSRICLRRHASSCSAMLEVSFTPTFNSLAVAARWRETASAQAAQRRVTAGQCGDLLEAAAICPMSGFLARNANCYTYHCPFACDGPGPSLPDLSMRLVRVGGPSTAGPQRRRAGSDSNDSSDDEGSSVDVGGYDATKEEVVLSGPEPRRGAFHLLEAGCPFAAIVAVRSSTKVAAANVDAGVHVQVGDIVRLDDKHLARVTAAPKRKSRSSLLGLLQPSEDEVVPVETASEHGVRHGEVVLSSRGRQLLPEFTGSGSLLVFNCGTLRNVFGWRDRVLRAVLMPWHRLGPWMTAIGGNYAYAACLDERFVVELLEHGLFVLPGGQDIFSCPFPMRPFIFKMQEHDANTWRRCKMLKRYRSEFELSCNEDLPGHLRRCGAYHEEKGHRRVGSCEFRPCHRRVFPRLQHVLLGQRPEVHRSHPV